VPSSNRSQGALNRACNTAADHKPQAASRSRNAPTRFRHKQRSQAQQPTKVRERSNGQAQHANRNKPQQPTGSRTCAPRNKRKQSHGQAASNRQQHAQRAQQAPQQGFRRISNQPPRQQAGLQTTRRLSAARQ
jgi:hypothetical protein